ncbi:cupin domain-containing protein [Marinobacter halodurans]|uniref:Cupin domain-containing protein n=1 Tax=Marinobacter halodurans TaxID=2528979 RepID=A0ABY1ZF40_9GAMM|nr:cupin domain-containing protein [Marinobacter halodurans]TBW49119.1 cupin domain-containing protein [Marinobacter halodurans]
MDKYHLTKADIDQFEGIGKTHFLNDNAKRTNKSLGDLTGITGFGFHIIEVQPGRESTEFHRHYYEDECVYVLEGTAEARIGDKTVQVNAGDFLGYRAGGDAHSLRNNGDTVLKCIVVGERRDHDVGDYPDLNKRIYRNKGRPWNLVDIDVISEPSGGRKV